MIDRGFRVAGHLIRRAHQVHDALFSQHATGLDLTSPQFAALRAIDMHPGIELTQLAEVIGYDSATLGGLITRLLAKKLVTRRVGKHDRRTRQIALTAKGATLVREALPRALRVEAAMLSALEPHEREAFIGMLERVVVKATADAAMDVAESA